ncbi:MAG: hypothetical protein ACOYIS_05925 [Candidatus Cloacimonadaceae bacterium]|jgi:hypothetical protein
MVRVRGLETFKNHFAEYPDQYVLIGGAASAELMHQAGLEFRGTRDLDVVLVVEALRPEFVRAFWNFIEKGKYGSKLQSQTKRQYYRFEKPGDEIYPDCIELFSRIPDNIQFEGQGRFTPIPIDEDISSLSAILLDDAYYPLIVEGKTDVYGLSCLKAEYLIILKAKAWLDMTRRRASGKQMDSEKIKKQRNDVIRLFSLLEPDLRVSIPETIKDDFREYLKAIQGDNSINLKDLGIRRLSLQDLVQRFELIYGLTQE